jgi:hypothetical protein
MNDRELLEMAAKAAGIDRRYYEYLGEWGLINDDGDGGFWNPLIDDGDALRLVVALGLTVVVQSHECEVFDDFDKCLSSVPIFHASVCLSPEEATDPCAATRRAIVRAAAEIGKATP